MRKLTHEELLERQQSLSKNEKFPFTVVLNDIRSLYNVGSIFRTADGLGVEKIWLCGITGCPPENMISKTALGAEKEVPWEFGEHVVEVVQHLKDQGYRIVLLEQLDESIPHDRFEPLGKTCLVLGNENSGVSDDLVSLCDQAVEIEMLGLKNSFNVSVAFGIVADQMRRSFARKSVA